jgi:hypothetical protein
MLDPMGIFPYFFTKKYWIKNLLGKKTLYVVGGGLISPISLNGL